MANEANMSLFRDRLEKIDYNEAVLLAGLNFLYQEKREGSYMYQITHPDYHVARSLMRKSELCIAVVEEVTHKQICLTRTLALGRFVDFIGLKCKPIHR